MKSRPTNPANSSTGNHRIDKHIQHSVHRIDKHIQHSVHSVLTISSLQQIQNYACGAILKLFKSVYMFYKER